MRYYKIVGVKQKVGTIIDTSERIDYLRIKRFEELKSLFQLIFEFSIKFNFSIEKTLTLIFSEMNEFSNNNELQTIQTEIINKKFICQKEFNYFIDFVLDKIRNESDFKLCPDRFRSNYFFKKLDDCFIYNSNLGNINSPKVIEVEFLSVNSIFEGDNQLLTKFSKDFTAKDLYYQAKDFLSQKRTDDPLIEVVFNGKYRILNCYTSNVFTKRHNVIKNISNFF